MTVLMTVGRRVFIALGTGLCQLAIGVLVESHRRTRWWIRMSPLKRTLLLVFSVIWITGMAVFVAFLLYIFWLAGADIFR